MQTSCKHAADALLTFCLYKHSSTMVGLLRHTGRFHYGSSKCTVDFKPEFFPIFDTTETLIRYTEETAHKVFLRLSTSCSEANFLEDDEMAYNDHIAATSPSPKLAAMGHNIIINYKLHVYQQSQQ